MEVPQKKAGADAALWRGEVAAFKDLVEGLSGNRITPNGLKDAIRLVNRKRRALAAINSTRRLDNPPISGLDALLVSQLALNMDAGKFCREAEALSAELDLRACRGISAYPRAGRRVIMAGTPSPMGNAKVHSVVEQAGLRIVADESCTGQRYFRDLVDESPSSVDGMISAIADRYFKIDCACFSPNSERFANLGALISEYRADGVIQNILQFCHGFNVEAKAVENSLAKSEIKSLKIETDYSEEDFEQIKVRVETFAELLPDRRAAAPAGSAKPGPKG